MNLSGAPSPSKATTYHMQELLTWVKLTWFHCRSDDISDEPRMKKPHKSRRKKRPDFDEYYWPKCKLGDNHLPENFKLSQVRTLYWAPYILKIFYPRIARKSQRATHIYLRQFFLLKLASKWAWVKIIWCLESLIRKCSMTILIGPLTRNMSTKLAKKLRFQSKSSCRSICRFYREPFVADHLRRPTFPAAQPVSRSYVKIRSQVRLQNGAVKTGVVQ